MYKKYYSPFEEEPIVKEAGTGQTVRYTPKAEPEVILPQKALPPQKEGYSKPPEKDNYESDKGEISEKKGVFGSVTAEDLILLGILVLLLLEDKEHRDMPLVLAIAFLLLVEYI
ncbi:MAG: hypothetical protein PHF89_05300 [Eubacteriales bacterium]|jgi:hypothetical protein|nr:hypothetical protein [Eubacteriales bacterium]